MVPHHLAQLSAPTRSLRGPPRALSRPLPKTCMARELSMVCKNEYCVKSVLGRISGKAYCSSPLASHPNFERQLSYTVLPCKNNSPVLLVRPVLQSLVLHGHCIFTLLDTNLVNTGFLFLHRHLHSSLLDFASGPAKPKALTPLPFADRPARPSSGVKCTPSRRGSSFCGPSRPPSCSSLRAQAPPPRGRPTHARPPCSGGITGFHCLQTTDVAR